MNTLTNAPLADLLQRLFAEAEASAPGDSPALADLSEAELKRLMGSKTEYREFYGRLKDLALPVSRETGCLLYMLARSSSARSIVEFGTSFGLSTLHLAAALRDNGGGRLIGSEFEPSKAERARRNLAAGGCSTWWNCARATPCKPRQGPAGQHRPGPAGRRQGALPGGPRPAGKPPAPRRAGDRRQRRA